MDGQFAVARAPVTLEYVLEVLRDSYRQQCQYDPEAEPDVELSFETTVAEWRSACDLLPWWELAGALSVEWGVPCRREEWKAVLKPAKRRTLRDVCTLLARYAKIPQARPVAVLGSRCDAAGMFLTVRSLLQEAGADMTKIAPSTPLDSYASRYCQVFLGPISRLAPGALPPVRIHNPMHSSAVWGLLVGWILLIGGVCALERVWKGLAELENSG
jgi:hypothetical protein